jgi:hypothetical protein
MPSTGGKKREVLVRRGGAGTPDSKHTKAENSLVHRGRMLQLNEQRPSVDGEIHPPIELLICFVKHLVRNTVSHDALLLSLYAATRETGATRAEITALKKAILNERNLKSPWPKDF